MGRIENKVYKNVFVTHEETKTLQVYMKSKMLCGDIFRIEVEKPKIVDIAIFCGALEKKDFNVLINKIKSITSKPTIITITTDNKNINIDKYIENYKLTFTHFTKNVVVKSVIIEKDSNKKVNVMKKRPF